MLKSLLSALVLALATSPAPAVVWVRVDTPHFVVFGQPGEKKTREIAVEFERFRHAIARVLPNATGNSAVPTIVVLFDNQRSFAPFAPRFKGKPVALDGYFQGSDTDNIITLSLEKRGSALRIVFHEYTHLVISGPGRGLPAWLNEGLAEYYSTFEVREDGRGGITGNVIPSHLQILGTRKMMSLDELLAIQRDSPSYNEGERRSMFYAQSWALVHMLLSADQNRSAHLERYMGLTIGGVPTREAWRQVFGDFDPIPRLEQYVRRGTLSGLSYRFADQIKAATATASVPTSADVEGVFGMLLRQIDPPAAEARLQKAAGMNPPSALARALLGAIKADSDEDRPQAAADALLFAATAGTPDWLTQYYAGSGFARLVSGRELHSDQPRIEAARKALGAVMRARPDLAHAHALMAYVVNNEDALVSVIRARRLAPGRMDYVYLEAQIRANIGELAQARAALAPLLTAASTSDLRERARALMQEIDARERARQKPTAPPRPSTPGDPIRVDGLKPGITYTYRTVKPDEKRLEGTLHRIECARNGAITLHVGSEGALRLFDARALREIEFITYRDGQARPVGCGGRTPHEKVYVTWRPLTPLVAGFTGRAVAVEFLPDK